MNRTLPYVLAGALAVMAMSCAQDPIPAKPENEPGLDVFSKTVPSGYYNVANVTVPVGTETVYIEYKGADGRKKTVAQPVTPLVGEPAEGRDPEPFGTVSLLLKSEKPSRVSIYYLLNDATTKAGGEDRIDIVENLPVNMVTSGEFGKTRYVQMTWDYAWENKEVYQWHYENVRKYPADIVMYDAEHNHTLRYKYAYSGVRGEGYMLEDAYEIVDHVAVRAKYNYCGPGCVHCQFCMPWGCSCGCGGWDNEKQHAKLMPNPDFVPNGNLLQPAIEDGASTEVPVIPDNVVTVPLPEPASYVTSDGDYTNYHSSGAVMFDDKWPALPEASGEGLYDLDFNDVVVDYDIEAVTVSDALLEKEGWREQVKVVLHLRALGSKDIWRVGLALENFNTDYVQSVSEYKTLDSWQNPHGELPDWARSVLFQENSIHYDAVSGTQYSRNTLRPAVEMGQLQAFNGTRRDGAGWQVYQYKDDHGNITDHVMNPALKQWDNWKTPNENQYSPDLEEKAAPSSLSSIQKLTFYNTIPGYVNVAGGLYTYTVIYHMKPRAKMDPVQREAARQNMIDAVMNTSGQNFFAVKGDFTPIGLKGYEPLDYKTKDNHNYADEYRKNYESNTDHLSAQTTYVAKNGQVWAFKCPVQTRHAWEKQYFSKAYPHYDAWVTSGGTEYEDWYKDESVDYTYLSCEW